MYYNAIQALFIIILWTIKEIVGTDPNYRAFSQHEHGYEYGYINMKAYPGKKLNMTAFKTTITTDVNQCAIDCFTSVTKQCQSLNIERIQPEMEYKCEMMELDKHKAYPHFVDAKNNATTHYDVSNHCSKPRPCPSDNHWCIPNHVTGEKQCQCKSNYTGADCKSERKTFRLKIKKGTDNEPYMEKPIDASVSSDVSVSFKYFVDVLESGSTSRHLASISMPPYCDPFRLFFNEGQGTIKVAKVSYPFTPLAVMKWHHMVVIVDMSRSVVKIYSNGKFLMECPLIGYKDNNIDIVTQLQVSLGGYLKPSCEKGLATFTIRGRFAEAYAWNRVLDDNDIPLLYKTKFIPYNPIIKWEEFRGQENKEVNTLDIDIENLMGAAE